MQRNKAPGELELVRRFVNTRDIEEGSEEFDSPDSLVAWFAGMGLLGGEATADQEDLERALALREGIRSLLLANNGKEIEPERIRELNRVTGSVCLTVCFDDGGRATLKPQSSGVSAALGRILAAVVRATEEGGWGRLKVCPNDACRWAFYDRSKNRSGKWCTMEVCGNRMKARAFRQRQASGKG
ncbi:zf-CGNR multi-domain protein [Rubrobacter taiwanensis]|uniref:Zf-CGNR multi-domain protein n=1 Tax=Rubrobacter taiwanensis TaxID=185139 RepID=A0A4V2NXC4_9ACTN|nr:CGNR zinc finger domain-containing protein [Rubrobacter taiwanensis]TCJ20742.1 zf-CGNR multi-domain protein [Rubrobacter taiwanensis]